MIQCAAATVRPVDETSLKRSLSLNKSMFNNKGKETK